MAPACAVCYPEILLKKKKKKYEGPYNNRVITFSAFKKLKYLLHQIKNKHKITLMIFAFCTRKINRRT